MGFWDAVVIMFIVGAVIWLRAQKYRARGDGATPTIGAREPELEREVQDLRKRIAVLERIATDDRQGTDLKRQIEALRD
ncbi:hypothetical protein [Novosphingobium aquimarinum]|jgi:hypothetical protein|uniref:hypothetical protein n=1 Tax=Novosphingobium aquimarinum TaxID=2682494 RepID=UPI0012EBBC7F|nr:hypothetical protein [Novosphingobium aquimarinum]